MIKCPSQTHGARFASPVQYENTVLLVSVTLLVTAGSLEFKRVSCLNTDTNDSFHHRNQ